MPSWPTPTSVYKVGSFLRLASHYRPLIADFVVIAEPLARRQQKTIPFVWSDREQRSFNDIRDSLCAAPILIYADFQPVARTLAMNTDANKHAIGAVLPQRLANDVWNVIAFASRDLSSRERNYCTTGKEMPAFIYVVRHFSHYLLGRRFLVRTDRKSLLWLHSLHKPEGQTAHWK